VNVYVYSTFTIVEAALVGQERSVDAKVDDSGEVIFDVTVRTLVF
jgi:hypothetical protein